MSNGIDIRQNEEKSIAMLAAQKQLYKDAKNFNYAVIVLSLIFPFLMSVLLVFFQNPSFKMASLIAVIVSIVLNILFGNFIKRKRNSQLIFNRNLMYMSIRCRGTSVCLGKRKM